MGQPPSLLLVSESRADTELIASALSESDDPPRVAFAEDEATVLDHVSREHCDLIVVRRTGGRLPALRLLELLRTRRIDVPVIVFSDGHTDEELVEVMRAGARDCLERSDVGRLGACLAREVREAEGRRAAAPGGEALPEDRYRTLVEEIPALIYAAWADDVGSRAYLSPQLEAMTGFKPVEWLAEPDAWVRHLHPRDQERVLGEFRRSCAQGDTFLSEYRVLCRDDRIAWWHDQGRVVRGADGRATFVRGYIQDVTEQKEAAETIRRMRFYDMLTGLPNRLLLQDRLGQALAESSRDGKPLALLILALDRFREISNTLGRQNGDLIIRELAQRMGDVLGEPERVARLRGDEFGVLLPGSDVALARQIGDKLLGLFERPFMVRVLTVEVGASVTLPIEVGASVGIAAAPEHGQEAEVLLRRADLAVQEAKKLASGCVVYSAECDPYDPRRLRLLGELRPAIEADQLFLFYQPKVDLRTRAVVGAEALLRWRHPKHGMVPPGDFIPLAEQAGVMKPLTWWVLEQAVRQCRAWERDDLGLGVAVNLSPRGLHDPQLLERIADLLSDHDVPPRRLQLEVTETAVMTDPTRAKEILDRLNDLGVGVSIDDFGTGYSSLTSLRELPVSEIKIDKSFVIGMRVNGSPDEANAGSASNRAIVRSTSDLGHNLGLRVVAEGVEDDAAFELLRSYGCDLAQGYYIARPMPAEAFGAWQAQSPWRRAGS
jgi:diguanylate cyclase (GGDEF)-like protein/PAS domain S-box-containing protein